MTNAIFTISESSAYDDQIESRYHFPQRYLGHVRKTVGDLVIYYEPRRSDGPAASKGRLSYFAMAQVVDIEPDTKRPAHFYAWLKNYLEFDTLVGFRDGPGPFESSLQRPDGGLNMGSFRRSVRLLPLEEFEAILRSGFSEVLEPWEQRVAEEVPEYITRPWIEKVVSRRFRDVLFRRHVRAAYGNTCAVTGLRLVNGGGRPEVQAAHIRPVEADGPDTVRNGLALTGTAHWLFDRGLISVDDQFNVLLSPHGIPDDLAKILRKDRSLVLPARQELFPHPTYLRWHRENRFKS